MTQKKIEPRRLKGFRDYLPGLCATRYDILDKAREVAARFAFQMVATPCLEYAEVLLGQGSDETDKQVYRFKDHGDRDVALRFDLTVPFARFVAEHQNDLVFPFRRMQIGEVWRGENTQKGRYREFCQCDIDIIGEDTVAADAEVMLCVKSIISALQIGDFTMRLGNRPILAALIDNCLFKNVVAPSSEGTAGAATDNRVVAALIWVDKLPKIGLEETVKGLGGLAGASIDGARTLLQLLAAGEKGCDLAGIRGVLKAASGNERALGELDRFEALLQKCGSLGKQSGGKLVPDISIARGLGYYTGVVYETFLDGLPGIGSISSGGRYDDLASRFSNRRLPGVGGSLGVDRLIAALEELGRLKNAASQTVFVAVASEDAADYGFAVAMQMRGAGIATDMALKAGKLGNQFKFADRMAYAHVLTVGTDEVTQQTVAVKNMRTGAEKRGVPLGELTGFLRNIEGKARHD